jgi:hypothetical protein
MVRGIEGWPLGAGDTQEAYMPKRTKPTAAPWRVTDFVKDMAFAHPGDQETFALRAIYGAGNVEVAFVYEGDTANARLIAAAPRMLEALKRLSYAFAHPSMQGEPQRLCADDLREATAAIAAAEGGGVDVMTDTVREVDAATFKAICVNRDARARVVRQIKRAKARFKDSASMAERLAVLLPLQAVLRDLEAEGQRLIRL